MFSLIENEPIEIDWKGQSLSVDFSFDTVISVLEYLKNKKLSVIGKIEIAFTFLVLDNEDQNYSILDKKEILEELFKLLFPNENRIQYDLRGDPIPQKDKEAKKQQFSFSQDASYIYSSFLQAYQIDLHDELGKLSWEKFRILLRDLPPDSKFKKILEIREWKPKKGESAEERNRMKELQDYYALNDERDD